MFPPFEMYSTLIDVESLRARLGDPAVLIVDVRHQLADPTAGERAYREGHIPGAVFMHLDRNLSGAKSGRNGRHPLPDPEQLAKCFGEFGIHSNTQVIVYDDAIGMVAGRLWWLLKWLGHDHVALLDGGWQAWIAQGGSSTMEVPNPKHSCFKANIRPDLLVTVDQVVANLELQQFVVLDARSSDRFRGENETLDPVGGHIPNACNRFFRENLMPGGELKPVEQLKAEYQELLGGRPPNQIVHQCGSGVSACLNILAMEHAGLAGSRLYAGSWSEWCAEFDSPQARPVELGA